MNRKRTFIILASIACFTACIADFWITFLLGGYKPGYSQLRNTMSMLGVSGSPVSTLISAWWIILGFLIILFAIGFSKAFGYNSTPVKISTWLLILYGLGEGLGSGLFKANHVNNSFTLSGNIHEVAGAIGTIAILVLPLSMIKIIRRPAHPGFHTFSWIVYITGLILLIMFIFRLTPWKMDQLFLYKGLWQRLFILDYYIYIIVIAILMIKKVQVESKIL